MIDIPPGKYFISHSYKDADVRDEMIKQLPDGVESFIFPPISVTPQEFVSNALIEAILECDGMVYLNEGASAKSFWVAFERDYALRAKRNVFGFTPSKHEVYQHSSPPLDLEIYVYYRSLDEEIVLPILEFMKEERYFSPFSKRTGIPVGTPEWELFMWKRLSNIIKKGGCFLEFYKEDDSIWVNDERSMCFRLDGTMLLAGLTHPCFPPLHYLADENYLVLADENGLNNNRIDDLIVRLYWLIFRNQFPELAYD